MTEDLRAKTCCVPGHRRIPEEALPRLERRLNEELEALAARGVIYFGAGGALGFDTLAAEAVIRLQRTRPQVKLILVLPSPDQTRGWSSGNVRRYEAIRRNGRHRLHRPLCPKTGIAGDQSGGNRAITATWLIKKRRIASGASL